MRRGFTIVELLIVIVVIAILAAITVVAYTGVQNQANDAAVRSDLAAIAKKYELYKVEYDAYPYGTPLNDGSTIKHAVAKASYATSGYQLLNCTSTAAQGSDYAMLALSVSGKRFYVSSLNSAVQEYTGPAAWIDTSVTTGCAAVLPGSSGNGAGYSNSTSWRPWTAG